MKSIEKSVLITGVSSGIGYSLASQFCKLGYTTFGSVRSASDGEALQNKFGENFHPLVFDVRNPDQIQKSFLLVKDILKQRSLDILINNAGVAFPGPAKDMPEEIIRLHYEVNVFGLLSVTRTFLPLLGATKSFSGEPGTIVNISSVAGKLAPPFLGIYASSKFAVEAISHTLRRELGLYGIKVLIVGPGNVKTPIWDKGADISYYEKSDYAQSLLQFKIEATKDAQANGAEPEELAAEIISSVLKKETPIRIAPVKDRFKNWTLPRLLSNRMLDKMIMGRFGLKRS